MEGAASVNGVSVVSIRMVARVVMSGVVRIFFMVLMTTVGFVEAFIFFGGFEDLVTITCKFF